MPPSLVKPARWAVNRALLEADGKNLSRGLVDLLPLWDDAPLNVGPEHFANQPKYGISSLGSWTSKREPTSHGIGWKYSGASPAEGSFKTDRGLVRSDEWFTDRTSLYVYRLDTNTVDAGIESAYKPNLGYDILWFDTVSSEMRIAYSAGTVAYGPVFHTASDNGTTYVVIHRNDHTNTRTDVWVNGVNHISAADRASAAPDDTYYRAIGMAQNTKFLHGVVVTHAHWNRCLTDTEIQKVSADPFILLRRDYAIPTVLALITGTLYTEALAAATTITAVITNKNKFVRTLAATATSTVALARKLSLKMTIPATTTIAAAITQNNLLFTKAVAAVTTFTAGLALKYMPKRSVAALTVITPTLSKYSKLYKTLAVSVAFALGQLPAGGVSRLVASIFHDDALMRYLLDNDAFTSIEVVGALNQINGTAGVEYWEARKTYLLS